MQERNDNQTNWFQGVYNYLRNYYRSKTEYSRISTGFMELPVRQAVKENRIKTIKDMLSRDQYDVNEPIIKPSAHTILHESIILNRKEIFTLCLLYKANVNQPDSNGVTPLIKAASLGRADMVKSLLDNGAKIDTKGPDGFTALDKAKLFDRYECINIFADPSKPRDTRSRSTDRFDDR